MNVMVSSSNASIANPPRSKPFLNAGKAEHRRAGQEHADAEPGPLLARWLATVGCVELGRAHVTGERCRAGASSGSVAEENRHAGLSRRRLLVDRRKQHEPHSRGRKHESEESSPDWRPAGSVGNGDLGQAVRMSGRRHDYSIGASRLPHEPLERVAR